MIESIRTLIWLRWRLLVNSLRPSSRDTIERFSRALDVLVPILLLIVLAPTLLSIAVLAPLGGSALPGDESLRPVVLILVRVGLGAVLLLAVFLPVLRARQAGGIGRLLLSPLSRSALHVADAAAGLADPWLLAAVPVLLLMPLGIAAAGAWWAALQSAIAGVFTLATLIFAGAAAAHGLMLVFRKRGRGEWAVLALMGLLIVGELLFVWSLPSGDGRAVPATRSQSGALLSETFPYWSWAVPTESFAMVLSRSTRGETAWFPLALSCAWMAVAFGVSRSLFRRLAQAPNEGSGTRGGARRWLPGWPAVWVGPGVAAVMQAHLRFFLRTLRGKTAVYGAPLPGLIFGVMLRGQSSASRESGLGTALFLMVSITGLCMLYLQPLVANQFAAEAGGFTRQRLSPLSLRELLRGRFAAALAVYLVITTVSLAVFWMLFPMIEPVLVAAALMAGCSTFALLLPLAALLSAIFPKAADLSRFGSAGNPNAVAATILSIAILLVFGPVAGLFGLIWWWIGSALAMALAAFVCTTAALTVAVFLLNLVEPAVATRLENLSIAAQGR